MAINITSPITGAAVTGLTSPTYTLVDDTYPSGSNGKQKAVTALGGTQAGVTPHTVSSPFTITSIRPLSYKMLGQPDANGLIRSVPMNNLRIITRKGVTPASGQPTKALIITTEISVPAGADTYDMANVRAALSAHIGALSQQSSGISDTATSGIL